MNIYLMERGFVLCGRPMQSQRDALFIVLKDCGVIRRWGTTKGLGELASKGPQSNTIIDREPDGTRIRATAIYRELPCSETAWSKWPK